MVLLWRDNTKLLSVLCTCITSILMFAFGWTVWSLLRMLCSLKWGCSRLFWAESHEISGFFSMYYTGWQIQSLYAGRLGWRLRRSFPAVWFKSETHIPTRGKSNQTPSPVKQTFLLYSPRSVLCCQYLYKVWLWISTEVRYLTAESKAVHKNGNCVS